jgi:hypothetical protein
LITSEEAQEAKSDVLGMIYEGKVDTTSTWVETSALLITKVVGEPFRQYFVITMTNDLTEDDIDELRRLEGELEKSLADCVVERDSYNKPHSFFPGSLSFTTVMIYGG